MTKPDTDVGTNTARTAGRGGLAVLTAKVFFIATGFVQQPLLQRAIGLADYGLLSRVLAVSNVFNNVVVSSSTQGVSRTVAAAGAAERYAFRGALRVHFLIAAAAGILLAATAPLASHFEHAPQMLAPLLVMTGVLFIYGVYAPLVGYLNGKGLFGRQAALDIAAATFRTFFVIGLGWLFAKRFDLFATTLGTLPGVLGATIGAVSAAVGVFLIALRWTGTGTRFDGNVDRSKVPTFRTYLPLLLPVMVGQLFTNGLMQADILLLGRYLSISASDAGTSAQAANEWIAVYRASQLFAFLPYQMLFSVTQVLFPMLARAKAEDPSRIPELVARGCRIGAIVCGLLVVIVVALPTTLLHFAYGADVAMRGATTLRVLALGQAAFAILGLATTVLVSLGRERTALTLTAVALGLLVTLCAVLVPRAAFGMPQLETTAAAATLALTCALVVGVRTVRKAAGAFVPWKTAVRVGACVLAAFALGCVTPALSKWLTPFVAAGVGISYVLLLIVTGELGKSDLALVLSIAGRKAKR
jgi:stage V sporulation protein B